MEDVNFRKGDAKTEVFGSNRMLQPSPVEKIPDGPTTPEIAYQMVKDETFAQTQPRLNLATFVTTYMDDYATKLMNEAININYIDETEYPRIAVMNGKCINIVANLWNSPEKDTWKTGALAIGSSEACMLGGVAAWLRWRKKRQAQGKPFDKPNFVISTGFQVVWEKFAQLWQIEMREVPLTLDKTTLDPEEALKMLEKLYIDRISDLKAVIVRMSREFRVAVTIAVALMAFICFLFACDVINPSVGWIKR